jgi:hypothetical protein
MDKYDRGRECQVKEVRRWKLKYKLESKGHVVSTT